MFAKNCALAEQNIWNTHYIFIVLRISGSYKKNHMKNNFSLLKYKFSRFV